MSLDIVDPDCNCVVSNWYDTIELEFEQCECCGNIKNEYIDSEFNRKQLEQLNKKK